jgi:hypothetical protein
MRVRIVDVLRVWAVLAFAALFFIAMCAIAFADDRFVEAVHINADVNAAYAAKRDSCLDDAKAKIERLRTAGFDVLLMIVHKHGAPDTHAIVHLRLNGATYYLNNTTNVLATEWSELYDVVSIE